MRYGDNRGCVWGRGGGGINSTLPFVRQDSSFLPVLKCLTSLPAFTRGWQPVVDVRCHGWKMRPSLGIARPRKWIIASGREIDGCIGSLSRSDDSNAHTTLSRLLFLRWKGSRRKGVRLNFSARNYYTRASHPLSTVRQRVFNSFFNGGKDRISTFSVVTRNEQPRCNPSLSETRLFGEVAEKKKRREADGWFSLEIRPNRSIDSAFRIPSSLSFCIEFPYTVRGGENNEAWLV